MDIEPTDPRLLPVRLRRELLASGWDDAAILRAVRSRMFTRVRPGAYVDTQAYASLEEPIKHAVRARAAARQSKTSVVASHVSAIAMIPGVTIWDLDLSNVHLTRRDGRTGRKEAGIQQHRGKIVEGDVIGIGDIDVMAPHRALLETTTLTDVEHGLALANDMLHKKLVTHDQLTARYALMDHWPRTLTTDLVLRLADPRIESIGESRTFYAFFQHGLPTPVLQLEIRDEFGREIARLDFAWPELKVWVEFDGRVKYEKYLRPGERASDAVVREKKRQELVERLTGWRCIRLTWDDLRNPSRLVALIRAAFAEKSA